MKGNQDKDLVRAILALAQDLGIDAIAEGVETAEQMEQLKTLKCPMGQGYFVSSPLGSSETATLIERLKASKSAH